MNKADISKAREALSKLTKNIGSTGARIEILLDRLASALVPLAEKPVKTQDLLKVLDVLDVDPQILKNVEEIYEELQGAIESRSYGDEDDSDDDETLANLIEDFCDCLNEQLDLWEDELAE